jgi:2'-5' RNA ligase
MRMFVALQPPEGAVDHLDEFLDVRREAGPFRWTLAEQLHVTLAFLAEVPDRCYDDLVERLERAARRRTPVTTRVAGGGAFPDVARVATGARAAASRTGIAVDGQRFRPHLTLARLGRPAEVTPWVRLLDAYRGPEWSADHWVLVASHLGEGPRGRPRHEVVERFAVGWDVA